MRLPPHMDIKNGRLRINGQDCVALAEKYGTPLYVTSEDRVVEQFESYKKALTARYPKVQVLFAAKANGNLALMRLFVGTLHIHHYVAGGLAIALCAILNFAASEWFVFRK